MGCKFSDLTPRESSSPTGPIFHSDIKAENANLFTENYEILEIIGEGISHILSKYKEIYHFQEK